MTTWVRHTWTREDLCGDRVGEAYAEKGSVGDRHLHQSFDSTREIGVDVSRALEANRLMKGWVRFG